MKLITIIITIFIASLTVLYYLFLDKTSSFNEWIKIIQASLSVSGFTGIIYSIEIARKSARRSLNADSISLFDKFRDKRFEEIRNKAWNVKEKWDDNKENYREEVIKAYFTKTKPGSRPHPLHKELFSVFELIEFYNMLSVNKESAALIKSFRYFYFDYWREFLYEIAEILDPIFRAGCI